MSKVELKKAGVLVDSGTLLTGKEVSATGDGDLMTIAEGGTASNGVLAAGGSISNSGGLLDSYEMTGGVLSASGVVRNLTVTGGSLTLGGVTMDGTIFDGNNISYKFYAPTLRNSTLRNGASIQISSSVTIDTADIGSGSYLRISNWATGAQCGDVTVNGGSFRVEAALISDTVINSGTMDFLGGTLNGVTLTGGVLNASAGSAKNITVGGGSVALSGSTLTGVTLNAGSVTVSGGTLTDAAVTGGLLTVNSGTLSVSDVTLSGGSLYIANTMNNTTINGPVSISTNWGARFVGGMICDSGALDLMRGQVEGVTVGNGGLLKIRYGNASGSNVIVSGGSLYISQGSSLSGCTVSGGAVDLRDSILTGATLNDGSLSLDGGTLHGADVTGGVLTAYSGIADDITVIGGSVALSGGTLTGVTLNAGNATVSGGTLIGADVTGGLLTVSAGSVSNVTLTGGSLYTTGTMNNATISGSAAVSTNWGARFIGGTIRDGGTLDLTKGQIEGVQILDGGVLKIRYGNASGSNITVSGGSLYISQGSSVSGWTLAGGSIQLADATNTINGTLNWDITDGTAGKVIALNNLSGDYALAVTVDAAEQTAGEYVLASYAAGFTGNFTVKGSSGETLGTFELVDGACDTRLNIGGSYATLGVNSGNYLVMTVVSRYADVAFNSDWPPCPPELVIDGATITDLVYGENAFNDLERALPAVLDTGTIYAVGDGEVWSDDLQFGADVQHIFITGGTVNGFVLTGGTLAEGKVSGGTRSADFSVTVDNCLMDQTQYQQAISIGTTGETINGDVTISIRNSTLEDEYHSFYSVRTGVTGSLNGDLTLNFIDSVAKSDFYTAGRAVVGGTVTTNITGSTVGGNFAPDESATNFAAIVTNVTGSIIGGQLRGTGSNTATVATVQTNVTGSTIGDIYLAGGGHTITDSAVLNLTDSSVGGAILRVRPGKTYFGTAAATLNLFGVNTLAGTIDVDVVNMAEHAALNFINTSAITVAGLTFGGNNALTFDGSAAVNFTSQDLSGLSVTLDNANYIGGNFVAATGITALGTVNFAEFADRFSYTLNEGTLTYSAEADVKDGTCEASFSGGTYNLMTGGTITGAFFGTANASGDVTTTISGGTVGNALIAGAKVLSGSSASLGTVTLNLSGDADIIGGTANGGMLYTAGYAYGANPDVLDSSATLTVEKSVLNLTAGSVPAQNLYSGAHARKGAYTVVNATEVNVTGGSFGRIYGGGWAEKYGRSEVGSSTINVSGGTVGFIYAGGGNGPDSDGEDCGSFVTGDVTITVSDSAQADIVFLAGKNKYCYVGGDVTMTVSGTDKTMTRISGWNANGDKNTQGVTTLNVETNLNLEYLDNVKVIRISENKTLDVSTHLWHEAAAAMLIDFDLDEVTGADWTAMSGDGMDVYQAAQYTIDNGAVCRWNSESGKLIYESSGEESGYALSFFTEENVDKVRFFKA